MRQMARLQPRFREPSRGEKVYLALTAAFLIVMFVWSAFFQPPRQCPEDHYFHRDCEEMAKIPEP